MKKFWVNVTMTILSLWALNAGGAVDCAKKSNREAMQERCSNELASGQYSQVQVSPTCGALGAKWVQIANQGACGCCVLKKEAPTGASNNGGGVVGSVQTNIGGAANSCLVPLHQQHMETACQTAMGTGLYSETKVSPTCGALGLKWVQLANEGACGCCVLKKEAPTGTSNNGGGIIGAVETVAGVASGSCLVPSHQQQMESTCQTAMGTGLYSETKVSPTCGALGAKWVQLENKGACGCCALKREASSGASNNGGGLLGHIGNYKSRILDGRLVATPLSPATRAALLSRRDEVRLWAPICNNGALGLTKVKSGCEQGDMLEYSGMSCLLGESQRCNDVKRSQSPDGRFWRNPNAVANQAEPSKDSFSRDMLMGVLDYVAATKDKDTFASFLNYISDHQHKLCTDASDNKCLLYPSTRALIVNVAMRLGMTWPDFLGLPNPQLLDASIWRESLTVQRGYPLELVAHNILLRRALGENTEAMRNSAKRIASRQPLNPMFRWLDKGPSEEAAALTLEICKAQPGSEARDIFFAREIQFNESNELVLISNLNLGTRVKASDWASGHDCLIVLNALLR